MLKSHFSYPFSSPFQGFYLPVQILYIISLSWVEFPFLPSYQKSPFFIWWKSLCFIPSKHHSQFFFHFATSSLGWQMEAGKPHLPSCQNFSLLNLANPRVGGILSSAPSAPFFVFFLGKLHSSTPTSFIATWISSSCFDWKSRVLNSFIEMRILRAAKVSLQTNSTVCSSIAQTRKEMDSPAGE